MKTHTLHPKLSNFVETMLADFDLNYMFYGEFAQYINFIEEPSLPTMGVNVGKNGMNFYYNPKFIDGLSQEELNWGGLHEILHLMYNHPKRTREHHEHWLANVAQDWIINDILDNDFSKNNKRFSTRIPNTLVLPKEYANMVSEGTAKLYFEDVYDWAVKKQEEYEEEKSKHGKNQSQSGESDAQDDTGQSNEGKTQDDQGNQDGQGGGNGEDKETQNGQGNQSQSKDGRPDANGKYPDGYKSKVEKQMRDMFDRQKDNEELEQTFDRHMKNEIDDDIAQEIVNQVKEGLKARGLAKGNVEAVLGKLEQRRKDYLKEFKRAVQSLYGKSLHGTYARPSRIGLSGIKGKKRKGQGITVLLDTSGSMYGEFEKALSYVFQRNLIINLIQVDTEVSNFETIDSMKRFKELRIKGLGGTLLQPGIEYVKNNKELHNMNLCVLTDGYCDNLDFTGIPGCKKVLIVSTGVKVNAKASDGTVIKQILAEK